ncbi:MAG: sarcosine oxidase [Pseudomonadota bacterium]
MNRLTAHAERAGPLHAWHQDNEAHFGRFGVAHYGDEAGERASAQKLAICDLSLVPRCGFKGAGAGPWVSQHLKFPAQPNQALALSSDGLVARLSRDESLIVDSLSAPGVIEHINSKHAAETPERCYSLPRQDSHGLIALSGARAPDVLATLCAVDMATTQFTPGAVAQTSLARLGAVVVRHFSSSTPLYYLFADHCAQAYLWNVLRDALAEFSGDTVGLAAMSALFSQT